MQVLRFGCRPAHDEVACVLGGLFDALEARTAWLASEDHQATFGGDDASLEPSAMALHPQLGLERWP